MTPQKRWLKAELHAHCSLDPVDYKICPQTPAELIEEAAHLGYEVLAITCHNLDVWSPELSAYARGRGVLLIPGMEVSAEGERHTLVYNFHASAEQMSTLAQIRALRREDTLVIAPHPYFPGDICLGEHVEQNIDVFDAIEVSAFYLPGIDFNRRARRVAAAHGKPLVGNGDVHLLWQLDRTFSWIYAAKEDGVPGVLDAIRQGEVRLESRPYGVRDVCRWWGTVFYREATPVRSAPTAGPLLLPQG